MLGHSPTAPVSRRLLEQPNATDSYSDALSADEVATGVRPLPAGLTHEQAAGVAAGLMWALGRSHEAPSPLGEDAPLRDRAQIEHEYQGNLGLAKNPPPQWSPGQVEEELGVLAALGWVLGKSSSPLKGLTGAVDRAAVESELESAQRLTAASQVGGRLSRAFAGGVYDALAWVLERSDRQPGPP